jgi:hypothetical protein
VAPSEKFQVIGEYQHQLIPTYEQFLAANGIGIAGIEVIVDSNGRTFTYDVNTNTNYNPEAEARAGLFGMRSIAQYLDGLLRQGLAARAA